MAGEPDNSLPLECLDLWRRWGGYLDGELAPEDAARVKAHLAACNHCSEFVNSQREFNALVKKSLGAEANPMPAQLQARVLAALAGATAGQAHRHTHDHPHDGHSHEHSHDHDHDGHHPHDHAHDHGHDHHHDHAHDHGPARFGRGSRRVAVPLWSLALMVVACYALGAITILALREPTTPMVRIAALERDSEPLVSAAGESLKLNTPREGGYDGARRELQAAFRGMSLPKPNVKDMPMKAVNYGTAALGGDRKAVWVLYCSDDMAKDKERFVLMMVSEEHFKDAMTNAIAEAEMNGMVVLVWREKGVYCLLVTRLSREQAWKIKDSLTIQ